MDIDQINYVIDLFMLVGPIIVLIYFIHREEDTEFLTYIILAGLFFSRLDILFLHLDVHVLRRLLLFY